MLTELVLSLVLMDGLVLLLCGLLLLSRCWLAPYGPCELEINQEKTLVVNGGAPLLGELTSQGIFLPSACGGKGTCGHCRIEVLRGGGPVHPVESLVLSQVEIAQLFRLACQVRVRDQLSIRFPSEYLATVAFIAEVTETSEVAPDIRLLRLRLLEPASLPFKAGQYVQIAADLDGSAVYRGYSLANSPSSDDNLELHVRLVEGGIVSPWLHQIGPGTRINGSGPHGSAFLRAGDCRTVLCIAGGVGIAPMKAIVLSLTAKPLDRDLYLFYGARNPAQLYEHATFTAIAATQPRFHYLPALSDQELPPDSWPGARGIISLVVRDHFPADTSAQVYACGAPAMIEALLPILADKGIAAKDIHYDAF